MLTQLHRLAARYVRNVATPITIGALAALTPSPLHAQDVRRRVVANVFIGGNLYSMSDIGGELFRLGDSPTKRQTKLAVNAGAAVKLPLTPRLSLQPEIHFSSEGASVKATDATHAKSELDLDYLDIPVLVRYELGSPASHFQPFVVAGASAAYRVSCNLIVTLPDAAAAQACDVAERDANPNSHDFIRKFDTRAHVGVGTSIFRGARETILQVRYVYGLMNILNGLDASAHGAANRSLTFLIGVAL